MALERAVLLKHRVARARAAGEVNAALPPPRGMVSVIGLAMLPLATRALWGRLPLADQVSDEDIGRHVAALLLHGIGPVATPEQADGKSAKRKSKPKPKGKRHE